MLGEDLLIHFQKVQGNLNENKTPIRVPSKHIIPAESIVINKELGVGEFGVVQQGVWSNEDGERVQVAIKCLSKQRMQNNHMEFLKEAAIMHSIDHEYIVRLYGVVLETNALMLVTELAPLRSLLECLKEPTLRPTFHILSLCDFAVQICDGMQYLESKRLIHRDLAARNILVFAKNKVKISDFGLSRALGVGKDYYQTNFNVNLKLPIAWCAPECINFLKFTSSSDVWAYGVTLWEMFSYGFQPWAALTGQQILEAIDEPSFQRLEQPECCPKEYYTIMLKCWEHDPNKRPKFSEIAKMLPDCRPELVQVVKEMQDLSTSAAAAASTTTPSTMTASTIETSPSKSKKHYLQCKIGEIITVLDKKPCNLSSTPSNLSSTSSLGSSNTENYASLWKGALNNGKTGLFNPNCTVAYLGQNLPTSTHGGNNHSGNSYSTTIFSFFRGILDKQNMSHNNHNHNQSNNNNNGTNVGGIYSSKRRLRPEMISRPQGDLKHTGHIGADGVFFGDISFLRDKSNALPKQIVATLKAHDDKSDRSSLARTSSDLSDRTPLISKCNSSSLPEDKPCKAPPVSSQWSNFLNEKTDQHQSTRTGMKNGGTGSNSIVNDHEYHEISDEDDLTGLESPHFETLDFGPSLMDEVFKELDIIKPEFNDDLNEQQKAINDCNSNVKNEIKEIANKLALSSKDTSRKNKATVKPISPEEEQNLDSAIAMAKELASQSMMEFEFKPIHDVKTSTENGIGLSDSPKTPTSPNKKKFSFKFKNSPKVERKNFSEQAENISDIQSILTEEAKEAYNSLIEKGEGLEKSKGEANTEKSHVSSIYSSSSSYPPPTSAINTTNTTGTAAATNTTSHSPLETNLDEQNPLRLLRNGVFTVPKVKGNKQRIPATPQTASLARLTANVNRSNLGTPPPVPMPTTPPATTTTITITGNSDDFGSNQQLQQNALPLPPRDRSKQQPILKQHQRKHPLIIPGHNNGITVSPVTTPPPPPPLTPSSLESFGNGMDLPEPPMSSFKPHLPVLKQVLCPEPPPNYINNILRRESDSSEEKYSSPNSTSSPKRSSGPQPPPKPNRTFLNEEPLEAQVTVTTNTTTAMDNRSSISMPINSSNHPISETDSFTGSQTSIKTASSTNNHHVSCEDLLDFAADKSSLTRITNRSKGPDSDEVRVMQKVLANEVQLSSEECLNILNATDWDIHRAIKCIRLRETLKSHSINLDCNWAEMLAKFNWNIRQASNYLIATQGLPEDTTEV